MWSPSQLIISLVDFYVDRISKEPKSGACHSQWEKGKMCEQGLSESLSMGRPKAEM